MSIKKTPRYRSIADELINGIVSKKYPLGSSLPAETELCLQLQASRHTVREALRILEEAGLISRRQGSGSEVIAQTPPVRYRQTVDNIEDLMQYGNASRFQVFATREVPADALVASLLGCAVGTLCIELQGLRSERPVRAVGGAGSSASSPGRPFALSHVYFPPQPARRRDKLLQADTALPIMLAALDARTLGRIEQVFEAVALDGPTAERLQARKGAASLRAQRVYFDRDGQLTVAAISWHRADLFRYATVLRHESS
jgi:GntR family transcriptional regulator